MPAAVEAVLGLPGHLVEEKLSQSEHGECAAALRRFRMCGDALAIIPASDGSSHRDAVLLEVEVGPLQGAGFRLDIGRCL